MSNRNPNSKASVVASIPQKKDSSKQPSYTQWVQQDFFINIQQAIQAQVPSNTNSTTSSSPNNGFQSNQSIFVQQKGSCFMSHWKISKPTIMRQSKPKSKQYVDLSPVNSPPSASVVPSSNASTPKPTADIAVVHQS